MTKAWCPPLLKVTIVCSDPCEGWPCFECEMMVETIGAAMKAALGKDNVDFRHESVDEACKHWKSIEFNDLDAPYFLVGDEVKLNGPEWRSAPFEAVVSILATGVSRP